MERLYHGDQICTDVGSRDYELLGLQLSYGLAEKRLAKAFITAWCHADSVGNDNFAREWDLMESGATPCTPIKKRRQEAP